MAFTPGARIGPYEITGPIGVGGMGEVYRARDTRLGREVALKVLPDTFAGDRERLDRFEREARTLASLNHPHIAQIYGLEDAPGGPGGHRALVMELVHGEDLSERLARGAIPVAEALPIARQVADALEAAHEAGIVHRDLKPANIKVTDDGIVKVLDFGLAKAMDPVSAGSAAVSVMTSPAMTQAGIILGTAAYMSPEQARGRTVDKRADIWAFGAVCFEMLSGRRLFDGATVSDTIAAVLTREVDTSLLPPGVPPRVRALIARCLERDPKRRLRDIGDARMELEPASASGTAWVPAGAENIERAVDASPGPAPVRATVRALAWLSTALGVSLAAALAAPWFARQPAAPLPVIQFDVRPAPDSTLALSSRPAVALSPDGSALALAASSTGISRLYLRRRSDVEVREIPRTEGASDPAFSPDGRWVAFVTPAELRKVTLDGATVVSLAPVVDPRGLAWLDDQTIVAARAVGTGLSIVPAGGGSSREITTPDRARGERSHRWPAVVPGGKAVLFTVGSNANPDDYNDAQIDGVVLATGERKKVLDAASFVRCTTDGRLLFLRAGVLYAVAFDTDRLETAGEPAAVLPGVEGDATTGAGHFSMSADQTLAYVPGLGASNQRRLAWADRAGAYTPIDVGPAVFNEPAVAPDGRRFAVIVGVSGRGDVWTYDTDRQVFSRLTFDGHAATPYWAADGQAVYYSAIDAQAQQTALRRKRVDGSGEANALATVGGRAYLGYVDRGERFAVMAVIPQGRTSNIDIVRVPIAPPGQPVSIAASGALEYAPAVSPDGRWLAYVSTLSGQQEVYVREMDGTGQWQISTGGGVGPRWSPDGGEIFYRNDARQMAVRVQNSPRFAPGVAQVLFDGAFNWRTEPGMNYAIDPVTGRFLMIRPPAPVGVDGQSVVRVVTHWLTSPAAR